MNPASAGRQAGEQAHGRTVPWHDQLLSVAPGLVDGKNSEIASANQRAWRILEESCPALGLF
jgi:hypothetical protein